MAVVACMVSSLPGMPQAAPACEPSIAAAQYPAQAFPVRSLRVGPRVAISDTFARRTGAGSRSGEFGYDNKRGAGGSVEARTAGQGHHLRARRARAGSERGEREADVFPPRVHPQAA